MKFIFVTALYPKEFLEQYRKDTYNQVQHVADLFQWSVVEGLDNNNIDYHIVTLPSVPSYPFNYKKITTPSGDVLFKNKVVGKMLRYCDLLVYKTKSMEWALYRYLKDWIKFNLNNDEEFVILTYTPYIPYIKAARKIKKQFDNCKIVSIVTDLVDDMFNYAQNKRPLKIIQTKYEQFLTKRLYRHIDKFVFLSKYMIEKIPEAINKNMVMEGIYAGYFPSIRSKTNKVVFYSGTLNEFSGVKFLVDAFLLTTDQEYQLQICGAGVLANYVLQKSLEDSRIQYLGKLDREEVIEYQQKATVLINPRMPNAAITRYSFPSKTMEYFASGTPMIGYRLEGIPEEYYNHMFIVKEMSVKALSNTISYVLSLSREELSNKAQGAQNFIKVHKTAKEQVRRVIDFICDIDA